MDLLLEVLSGWIIHRSEYLD